jgi:hypothetical protein
MRNPTLLLAAAAALAVARPLAAQEREPGRLPELVQELFLVETVYLQERGEVQLTAFSRLQDQTHTRLLGEYGVTDRFQLSLVSPAVEGNGDEDESAWEAGVLYGVIPGQSPVALSAGIDVGMAKGERTTFEPLVVAARQWGPVQLHASVRTELHDVGDALGGGLGAMLDAGRLTPTLELAWSASEHEYVVPGLYVHPRRNVEAGFGLPLCLGCAGEGRQARAMVTMEF